MLFPPYSEWYHVSPPNILSGLHLWGGDKLILSDILNNRIEVNYLVCRAVSLLYTFLAETK